jgi:hypothetical protein
MDEASTRQSRWKVHVEMSGEGHQSQGASDGPNNVPLSVRVLAESLVKLNFVQDLPMGPLSV